MAIVIYICTHKIRGVALCAFATIKCHRKNWAQKTNIVVASFIALPYRVFLNHAIQSEMTRTKRDPADQMIWATQPGFNFVTDTQETLYRYTLHDSCYKVAFSSRINKPPN